MITEEQKRYLPKPDQRMFRSGNVIDPVYQDRIQNNRLLKIIDETKGDVCTNPLHRELVPHRHGNEVHPRFGFLTYHRTFPYPEKGWRDDYSLKSTAYVKRGFISQINFLSSKPMRLFLGLFFLLPWSWKKKIIEAWLYEFHTFTHLLLGSYFLEDKYLTNTCRELKKGIFIFLKELGISEKRAEYFSMTVAAFMEDTAYRYRFVDLMSETTRERFLENPAREIQRILEFLSRREKRVSLNRNFKNIGKLLCYTLYIPRIKRAFLKAINDVSFEEFQYDEIDQYHVRHMLGYEFFGMTIEERCAKWTPEEHDYSQFIFNPSKFVNIN